MHAFLPAENFASFSCSCGNCWNRVTGKGVPDCYLPSRQDIRVAMHIYIYIYIYIYSIESTFDGKRLAYVLYSVFSNYEHL